MRLNANRGVFDMDLIAYFVVLACSFAGGFVATLIANMLKERSYWALEKRVVSLENHLAGKAAVAKREDEKVELQLALAEAKGILENKELTQEAKMQAGLALLAKYPSSAKALMKMAQQFGLSI